VTVGVGGMYVHYIHIDTIKVGGYLIDCDGICMYTYFEFGWVGGFRLKDGLDSLADPLHSLITA
jgi:hypothetical protein